VICREIQVDLGEITEAADGWQQYSGVMLKLGCVELRCPMTSVNEL